MSSKKSGAQRRREQGERGDSRPATRGGAVVRTDADLFLAPQTLATIREIAKTFMAAKVTGRLQSLEEVVTVLITGRDLGLGPSQAVAGLYIAREEDGTQKVTMTGEVMRAMILRSGTGLLEPNVLEDERCVLHVVRFGVRGRPDTEVEVEWTRRMAERAGLWGKGSWAKYPGDLLFNRATSKAARLLFSDVLAGVSYTPEELGGTDIEFGAKESAPDKGFQTVGPAGKGNVPGRAADVPPPVVAGADGPSEARPSPTASGMPRKAPGKPVQARSSGQSTDPPTQTPTGAQIASGDAAPPAPTGMSPNATLKRTLTTTILLDVAGGGVKTVLTAGMTKPQYGMLVAMTTPEGGYPAWREAKAVGAVYVKRLGLEGSVYLTEAEAEALIAEMNKVMAPPPANAPVSGHAASPEWQQAYAEIERVIGVVGLDRTAAISGLCTLLRVARLEDAKAGDLVHGIDHLRELAGAAGDNPAMQLVMEQLKQQGELGG